MFFIKKNIDYIDNYIVIGIKISKYLGVFFHRECITIKIQLKSVIFFFYYTLETKYARKARSEYEPIFLLYS